MRGEADDNSVEERRWRRGELDLQSDRRTPPQLHKQHYTVRHTPHIHNQMHNLGAVKNKMTCTTLSRINIQKSEENKTQIGEIRIKKNYNSMNTTVL